MILLVVLVGVMACGPSEEQQAWILERAEMVRTIESLEAENNEFQGIMEQAKIPQITVAYFYKDQCAAIPYELETDEMNRVRFANQTKVDVTFTFPNPIFDVNILPLLPGEAKTLKLAAGASEFNRTDYALEGKCYKEPVPGPFILIP